MFVFVYSICSTGSSYNTIVGIVSETNNGDNQHILLRTENGDINFSCNNIQANVVTNGLKIKVIYNSNYVVSKIEFIKVNEEKAIVE